MTDTLKACSHLVITSKNVRRLVKFLDFFFELKPYFANAAFAEYVLPNGFRIAFFAPVGKAADFFAADGERHFASIGITTADVDLLFQKTAHPEFAAFGARVSGPPKDHPWGEKSFLLLDPDGNRWEITQSPSESGMLVNRE